MQFPHIRDFMMYSKEQIIKLYDSGKKIKFLHFWGHRPHPKGSVTSSCFSQWWASKFEVDGEIYPTTEHWMMAEKARLFKDEEVRLKILKSSSPGEAKQLGRQVKGFQQETWEQKRFEIVVKGNTHKFTQHTELREFLLNTKNRVLVEASPVDTIWGIGLDAKSEFANIPHKWRGLNLLGFALMEVRDLLK